MSLPHILLALLVTSGLPFRVQVRRLALTGATLAPLGLVVTGHTRTMSPAVVGYVADAAHVAAGDLAAAGALARWWRSQPAAAAPRTPGIVVVTSRL